MERYRVYGVTVATDLPLAWPLPPSDGQPDVTVTWSLEPPTELDLVSLSADRVEDPPQGITYHRLEGLDIVRVPRAADHYLWPDRIVCHLAGPDLLWLAEIHLLGMVLALWLERRGVPVLHASCVVVDDVAAAFLATKGGGKTTAASAMVSEGAAFLADDLLALDSRGGEVRAHPGYPMLRLWPEQADHFLGGHAHLPIVHPSYTKRRVRVGDDIGRFHPTSVPLARIYLPVRTESREPVEMAAVRSHDALLALVQHSFLGEAVHGLGLAQHRLASLAAIVGSVEVRQVRYPSGFDRLPDLVAGIREDLAAG